MKRQSELQASDLLAHLRIAQQWATSEDTAFAGACLDAARAYVADHCGIDAAYMDEHDDIAVAVLVLAGDMFDNRSAYVDDGYAPNRTVEAILGHHSRNLVEGMADAL